MGFFSNLFKRQESNSEEYVDFLLNELEKVKSENDELLKNEKNMIAELQEQLQKKAEENAELREKIDDLQKDDAGDVKLKEEYDRMCSKVISLQNEVKAESEKYKETSEQLKELQSQVNEYEAGYRDVMKHISKARQEADILVGNAQEQAKQLKEDAQNEAERLKTDALEKANQTKQKAKEEAERLSADTRERALRSAAEAEEEIKQYRFRIERELQEKARENDEKIMIARYRFSEYVNTFNNIKRTLTESYNEIGRLLEAMPVRIEDLLVDHSVWPADGGNENEIEDKGCKKESL